uniref:Uncharacterized protein n=1 Tax=Compsopogon caeruleus TaxID=31354 RepID=A0A7S1XDH8_9RHOD|mmetsp:Transcript_14486/g.29634  ORF Transcript_14486/g.29634 Transcript_14486/m.29634 type:complete len:205 (+) Transcript_14486:194-808(+)
MNDGVKELWLDVIESTVGETKFMAYVTADLASTEKVKSTLEELKRRWEERVARRVMEATARQAEEKEQAGGREKNRDLSDSGRCKGKRSADGSVKESGGKAAMDWGGFLLLEDLTELPDPFEGLHPLPPSDSTAPDIRLLDMDGSEILSDVGSVLESLNTSENGLTTITVPVLGRPVEFIDLKEWRNTRRIRYGKDKRESLKRK